MHRQDFTVPNSVSDFNGAGQNEGQATITVKSLYVYKVEH